MKNIIFTLLLFAFVATGVVYAQSKQANISFTETTHNFVTIKEADGKVTYKFEFVNVGGENLLVTRVQPSCGCTAPNWTKKPVAPGAKGFVSATFDPKRRPGNFNKSLTVYSNAEKSPMVLKITGNVVQAEKSIAERFPRVMGDLRLKSNHIAMAKITNEDVKTQVLEVINTSEKPLKVSFSKVPVHLTMKAFPDVLQPNQEGKIIATYNAKKKNDWGYVFDRVYLLFDDQQKVDFKNALTVSASIEEDFSKLSEKELAGAAHIKFENNTFEFGTIKEGESVEHEFVFTNTGKSDLIIRKTKASCGCTAISPTQKVIPAGETGIIKTKFNSRGKRGAQHKSITIVTNDPAQSTTRLWVKGTVETEQ